jgi:glycosyltransferase involved in cell wall biosynthesis
MTALVIRPLVSIIVPSFNQGRFIRETIDSILAQDYRPIEILVFDGGSTDETISVLESYSDLPELKWWSEPDKGVADAVNKGLAKAGGEILAIQSSDDLYLPGAIRAAVAAMAQHPAAAIVYGDVEYIDEDSQPVGKDYLRPFDLKDYLGRFTYIPQPSAFFRAAMSREVGGWRQEVSYAADADYWLRLAVRYRVLKIDRMMARYRYHAAQRDVQRSRIARDWKQAVLDLITANTLDKELVSFARMGISLAEYHYTPEFDWLTRTRHLYRAALANPKAVFNPNFPKRELLIGREPIWKFLSKVKRRLGFRPRRSEAARYTLKQKLGAIIYDLPGYVKAMRRTSRKTEDAPWLLIRNRNERLVQDERGIGAQCDWQWTSDLHVAKVFPRVGLNLMRRTLRDWPIALTASPATEASERLAVSFIIGHRGRSRMSHLLATLRSIAAQRNVSFECIVVEQSNEPEVERLLPHWVKYVHTPLPQADMPYSRSWAFNVGADLARGNLLILHDNDMLLPQDYASQMLARQREGYEVINLKRFVFYLDKEHSERIMTSDVLALDSTPECVVQNLEAGGSFAITRDAYRAIGGFDESFVGWGGEDNEFWERAQTRKVWPYGYMPLIHLWHEAQPGKFEQQRHTAALFEARSALPVEERIVELKERNFDSKRTLRSRLQTSIMSV